MVKEFISQLPPDKLTPFERHPYAGAVPAIHRHSEQFPNVTMIPSINKGRHGFDGQKCPHTASSPLRIRQYSLRVFPCLVTFLLRQNCKAPASDEFTSDFWLLRRRRAGARQDEKGKKRRKDTLAGVFALVNRW